ncbi:MAG: DNA polymerase [Nanoarchaeales archaeon]
MKIFILDCESYTENGEIKFGLAIAKELGKNNYLYFENKNDLKDWIIKGKKDKKHIYIHNGLRFDLELIFGYKELIKYNLIISNNKLYHAKIGNSRIYDSYLLLPLPLSEIAKNIGMEKGLLQEELAEMDREEFFRRKKEIEEYCKNDVDILDKALQWLFNFIKEQGITKYYKYLTIASISLHIISKKAKLKNKEWNINPYHQLFMLSYYGARTEAFFSGFYNQHFYVYDFNSLYPYCFTFPFPDQFLYAKVNVIENDLKDILLGEYEGLGLFHIQAPEKVFGYWNENNYIDIGLLPFKDIKEQKLIFPIGEFTGWYNFNEIRYAISHGYNVKAIIIYVFSRKYYNNVKDIMNEFYNLRKSDPKNSYLYKLIMNSFYGKFGQKNKSEKYYTLDNINYDYDNYDYYHELDDYDNIKYVREVEKLYNLSPHTDFSIASYITSHARIQLLQKFEEIIQKNGKILYCDTDSIFTNIQLPYSNNFGDIKLEHECIYAKFIGQKSYKIYDMNGKLIPKIKGIPKKAQILEENDAYEIYEYEQIIQFRTGLRKNYNNLSVIKTKKIIQNTYKRIKGKGFLLAISLNNLNDPDVNEYKINSLKDLFDKNNIKYPYNNDLEIIYQ